MSERVSESACVSACVREWGERGQRVTMASARAVKVRIAGLLVASEGEDADVAVHR
jgi:hypothetical protein